MCNADELVTDVCVPPAYPSVRPQPKTSKQTLLCPQKDMDEIWCSKNKQKLDIQVPPIRRG